MARTLKSDKLLFGTTMLLVCAGLVMIYSASAVQAQAKQGVPYYFLIRQFAWAVIGLPLMLIASRLDYHTYNRRALIWGLVGITFVALVAVFFFPPRNNTQRWLALDVLSVQPAEFAKLVVILFAAAALQAHEDRIKDLHGTLLPIAGVTLGFAALIVRQPDFGTAALIVVVIMAVLLAAGLSYRYFAGAALALVPVMVGLVLMKPYRLQRLLTFFGSSNDPLGADFQIRQTQIAVGSGGIFGRGLMSGVQKLYYIPESHTDFIFAVIAEEMGIIGTTVVVLCFLVIGWRGLRASLLAPDRFGALLALGLTMMLAGQALVNLSVVLQLLPTKGIPLPFVSNGGSSLVINLIAMGVLLNISQQSCAPESARTKVPTDWVLGPGHV